MLYADPIERTHKAWESEDAAGTAGGSACRLQLCRASGLGELGHLPPSRPGLSMSIVCVFTPPADVPNALDALVLHL